MYQHLHGQNIEAMLIKYDRALLASVTAAILTTATFSKLFLPFYLIGSTVVFAAMSAIGAALVVIGWPSINEMGSKVRDILLLLGALYGVVIANFLLLSRPTVPMTHLAGILIFHSLFLVFGFAAARALRIVLLMLLAAAVVYLIFIAQYTVRFGDLMRDGYLHDVFGTGDQGVFQTFHQNIGAVLGLAALAALGLVPSRTKRILAISALPLVSLFMFHIAARGALVALVCSLIFLRGASSWVRSKTLTVLGVIAVIVAVTFASALFYQRALQDKVVDQVAPDAISRTIREIQNPNPGLRLQIWARAWHHVSTEPDLLLFGRGIGMYPVDEGFGAPDWLRPNAEGSKHYPHNVHLEVLYESGIIGLLLFSVITLFPLLSSLRSWQLFSSVEKAAISLYVFILVSSEISGAFAFLYYLQFFLGLAVGISALRRMKDVAVAGLPPADDNLDHGYPECIPF
jgi:hypothetical protein